MPDHGSTSYHKPSSSQGGLQAISREHATQSSVSAWAAQHVAPSVESLFYMQPGRPATLVPDDLEPVYVGRRLPAAPTRAQ